MAKKEKKTRSETDMVISSEQINKINRAARRQADLERGTFIRGGIHKTAKKDKQDEQSNNVSFMELEELIDEEDL